MDRLHASELAPLVRQAAQSPAPGSIEERDALRALDEARLDDMYPQSRAQRRKRLERHWRDRGHQLGG